MIGSSGCADRAEARVRTTPTIVHGRSGLVVVIGACTVLPIAPAAGWKPSRCGGELVDDDVDAARDERLLGRFGPAGRACVASSIAIGLRSKSRPASSRMPIVSKKSVSTR